jgi:hypothetical protein
MEIRVVLIERRLREEWCDDDVVLNTHKFRRLKRERGSERKKEWEKEGVRERRSERKREWEKEGVRERVRDREKVCVEEE